MCDQSPHSKARELWIAIALFAVTTAVFSWPLGAHPATQTMDLGPDTRLFLWTLGWDWHILSTAPWNLFDANIFYPQAGTLAYSEHQLGAALMALPIWLVSDDPVLALNFVALVSIFLSGLGAYLLAKEIDLRFGAALFVGLIFAFAAPRFFRIGQLHLTTVHWMPLCLTAVHRYLRHGHRAALIASVMFFTLQAWSGGQNALFLSLTLVVVGSVTLAYGGVRTVRPFSDGLLAATLLVGLNAPLLLPYLNLQHTAGLSRTLADARAWSPNWESFLAAPTHLQSFLLASAEIRERVLGGAKAFLFPGAMAVVFASIGVVWPDGHTRNDPKRSPPKPQRLGLDILDALTLTSLCATAVVLANGGIFWPSLGIRASSALRPAVVTLVLAAARVTLFRFGGSSTVRLIREGARRWGVFWARRGGTPVGAYFLVLVFATWASLGPEHGMYTWLYRTVPAFDFIRVPSRLTLVSLLGLAVLAGVGLQRFHESIESRWPKVARLLVAAALGIALAEYCAIPLATSPIRRGTSALHRWIGDRPREPAFAIVALPFPDPRDEVEYARVQTVYMTYSMDHYRPMVNGYSGFIPAGQDAILRRVAQFPDLIAFEALEDIGVRFALVHRERYSDKEWRDLLGQLDSILTGNDRWEKRFEDPEGLVLELVR